MRGPDGIVVRLADDGTLRIGWRERHWLGPATLTIAGGGPTRVTTTRGAGVDDLGEYDALDLRWAPLPLALQGTVRVYRLRPLVVFRLAAPEGLAGDAAGPFEVPRVAWPHFRPTQRTAGGVPDGARTFALQWAEFALPLFGDADAGGFLLAPHRPPVASPLVTLHASRRRETLSERIALADLGAARPDGAVVQYDWRRGTFDRLAADGGWPVTLDFQDWDYRVLCPLLPGERALFGDVARYAIMGDRRVAGVAASVDSVSFDVIGMPGTIAEVHGYPPQPPHSVRAATYRGERALTRAAPQRRAPATSSGTRRRAAGSFAPPSTSPAAPASRWTGNRAQLERCVPTRFQ